MNAVLKLNNNKCVACYGCVRACPVKAIQVKEHNHKPYIVEENCIACGNCLEACSYSAIELISNIEIVEEILHSQSKVAAICDPSIAGEFSDVRDYRKFVSMIRKLGFDYVCEVSFGVDLVSNKFANLCNGYKGKSYISSHCPVNNMYIEKYQPDLVNNLSPIVPPAIACCSVVKKMYGEDIKVVNITPCLGLKKDNNRYEKGAKLDAFLSFLELRELFEKYKIKEESVEFSEFDAPHGYKGSLYPISEGFVEACGLSCSPSDNHILSVEGKKDAIDVLKQFAKHGNEFNTHFNIYFCKGCLMAHGCSKGEKFLRHNLVLKYADKKINTLDKEEWNKHLNQFENISDLVAFYKNNDKTLPIPNEEKIEQAFVELGKQFAGRNIDCKACGYETCQDLATAIAQGIASADMCFSFARKDSRISNDKLKVAKSELIDLQNKYNILEENLNVQILNNHELSSSLTSLIHHINPGIAIVNEKMKITDSNSGFIDILGEDAKEIDEIIPGLIGANAKSLLPEDIFLQLEYVLKTSQDIMNKDFEYNGRLINVSIFSLVENKSACLIFRNLYNEEERPEEIIHRVNDVIKENLLQVQQIGFILGEGAAKTEKMLNSIIKTYKEQIGQK
ncbi:MAG: [Fe-Fe] hydrogenase large subunit C-terminal domain-containing protein [Bacteroidales bacterium]|nr:[Fe-Fe] hydrogenase large subunit C-terminal domain-containing protein [Bacteroidales bacterium]